MTSEVPQPAEGFECVRALCELVLQNFSARTIILPTLTRSEHGRTVTPEEAIGFPESINATLDVPVVKQHFRACANSLPRFNTVPEGQRQSLTEKPEFVLRNALTAAVRESEDGAIFLDADFAIEYLKEASELANSDTPAFGMRAQLSGIYSHVGGYVTLPSGMQLRGLSDEHVRILFGREFYQPAFMTTNFMGLTNNLELFAYIRVAREPGSMLIEAQAKAFDDFLSRVERTVYALKLVTLGDIYCSRIETTSPFSPERRLVALGSKSFLSDHQVEIFASDLDEIRRSSSLVEASWEDPLLHLPLRRFGLSCSRIDPVDKIVDLAIAWESLLSQEGGNKSEQLSYRFRLHGSTLLCMASGISPEAGFKFLKGFYELRSLVVHGENPDKSNGIQKVLAAESVSSLSEYADLVAKRFSSAFLWLCSLEAKDRPQRGHLSWERLLWSSGCGPAIETAPPV